MQINQKTIDSLNQALTKAIQQTPLTATEIDEFKTAVKAVKSHKDSCSNYAETDGSEVGNGYVGATA
jgi:hypothetical protein